MENFIDIVSGGVLLVGALVAVLVLLWRGFLRTRLGRRVQRNHRWLERD